MSHLKVENLLKTYGTQKILKGISFEVKTGEFISLLGPSGCGKSTTLRCVAGLERPDAESGKISIGNYILSFEKVFLNPEKRNLGMVFQSYAVWPHLNVFDNVAFPLKLRKGSQALTKMEIGARVSETLSLVHLDGLEKRFSHELSGGQQQRVALARAIAMAPQILLLDEPLSNLDVLLREELRAELQRITKKLKMTTILVTHDQREALSLSQRIIILNNGVIEAEGTPEKLYSSPPSNFVAEFLAGGQSVTSASSKAQARALIPRFWTVVSDGSAPQKTVKAKIQSRLYLGHEYEYWGKTDHYNESIKFYSNQPLIEGAEVILSYQN
jgi:iron(III) transport system ATP-binding protein